MLPLGLLKSSPQDFIVEEIPAYEPSGAGDHLYVRFTKINLTTDTAVQAIAKALGASARDVGVAGMKDKVAVTTQTISIPVPRGVADFDAKARALTIDGITIHEAKAHTNKLKTGHLLGNRFAIVVRKIETARIPDVLRMFEMMARDGVPNAFGEQRFGRAKDNAERARAWLTGKERGPRDPKTKRLLWSSLQSAVFNAVLAERVQSGTWNKAMLGDVMKKRDTGGLYTSTNVDEDIARALTGEVSPTGPMVGVKMRAAEADAAELERGIATRILGEGFDLGATKALGEGTRRALRLWIEDLKASPLPSQSTAENAPETASALTALQINFVLPKGAYATTVLGEAFALEEPNRFVAEQGAASADETGEASSASVG
jgi:tRNA pseudouridine13 synthase